MHVRILVQKFAATITRRNLQVATLAHGPVGLQIRQRLNLPRLIMAVKLSG